ncbi:HAD family hydrolase [Porphyromonas pogonae]|uniref:HAD family hydrolase n=1 Tax=Porphyromonas pogonae TaxID=867595 RepID=UPI002E7A0004|nr:HAD hydrolase-like protein [Porphyromonas pogonae]
MDTKLIDTAVGEYLSAGNYAPRPLKAAFFDMDGVLFDSMPAHCCSWMEAATEAGLQASPEDFYMYEGQTAPFTIAVLFRRNGRGIPTPEDVRKIYIRKTELFTKYNTGNVIAGSDKVINYMAPYKRVLVTGSSQPSLLERINVAYPGVFDTGNMVTGHDVKIGKPNPEPYLIAMKKANCNCEECIVFENAPMGVRSAVSAGIFTIAINTGPLKDEILINEGANLLYHNMAEVLADLPEIVNAFSQSTLYVQKF